MTQLPEPPLGCAVDVARMIYRHLVIVRKLSEQTAVHRTTGWISSIFGIDIRASAEIVAAALDVFASEQRILIALLRDRLIPSKN